ncbi:MAG: ABC transporter ATP-binding protein [Deltaproteobacteria bacterium]|nr:ABC transporter ATP-binding protein [Deltaproteobacteria bacterium]
MSTSSNIISVEDLKVRLGGVSILDIPSFSVREGEFLSLIGPNGSGKSTFLLVLNSLLKPVSGRLLYKGEPITGRDGALRYRRKVSMVFQEPLLFDTTVYKNVASGLKIRGLKRDEIRERVMRYLGWFNIEHLAQRSARKLSGGEAQRTSLARAFAMEPEVIFLDEPFSALDPPTRHAISDDLERIVSETGITTIMVTHDQSEALRMSDRIAVMHDGGIVQIGAPSHVMNNPANEFVANFVGMDSILEGTVARVTDGMATVIVSGREIDAFGSAGSGDCVYCCIRPENVTIELSDPDDLTSARNTYPAVIRDISSIGPFLKVALDCGFSLTAFVTREAFAVLDLKEGKNVYASFKATAVHMIRDPKHL